MSKRGERHQTDGLRQLSNQERNKLGRARLQHGQIMALSNTILDAAGAISAPTVALPLLQQWEMVGTITPQMRAAGEHFHATFRLAALQHLRSSDMAGSGIPGQRGDGYAVEAARRRRDASIDALGGMQTIGGDIAWYVLGEDISIREWSHRPGRMLDPKVSKGVLVAVLDVLARHFGY